MKKLFDVGFKILLILIYFLVLLPIGKIRALFQIDSMKRKIDLTQQSYRVASVPLQKEHLEKPF